MSIRIKGLLLLSVLFIILTACNQNNYTSTGEVLENTYTYDGVERNYIVYLPDGYYKDAPLLFVFHGYTGTAENILEYADFRDLADEHDFVLCYPQGLEDQMGLNHWNANLTISDVDDIGFIEALSEELLEEYALDSNRVFTCGMSNGGFMSYTLAIHLNDTFRAMASVTGIMSGNEWEHRDEATPIPVLHIHGTADPVVLTDGNMTTYGGWGGAPKLTEIIEFWVELNEADIQSVDETDQTVTAYYYENQKSHNDVWYYEVKDMGHEWPTKEVNASFNATEVIWEFFSRYE